MCNISDFYLEVYAGSLSATPYSKPLTALPGETIKVYVTVNNVAGMNCHCATVSFTVNGTEFTRKEVCVNPGYTWEHFAYMETSATYIVTKEGTYNFCAEVVSVR